MKLSALLQKHNDFSPPEGLPHNFGDGYLCENNTIYRNVRKKTVSLGFQFSDKPDTNYLAFPMGQLENILSQKVIPYTDNVSALEILNKQAATLEWDHVVDNLKPNYVFHESCHAVARSFASANKSADLKLQLTVLLIEESFSNTCEFFAIADALDQTHRNFLEINSYFTVFEDRTSLKKLIEKAGSESIFKFMLLGYVHSNFLNEKLNDSDFKKIIELAGINTAEHHGALKSLAKNCFMLNPRFRYTTTEMYLRSHQIETPVELALQFDHLQLIKNNNDLTDLISDLSRIAGDQYGK